MNFFLDPETRSKVASAGSLFFGPTYPCSACFNGTMDKKFVQKVHINPPEAVSLTKDKNRLMKALNLKGIPVPDFYNKKQFFNKEDAFLAVDFMNEFSFDDGFFPALLSHGLQMDFSSLQEVVQAINAFNGPGFEGVFQKKTEGAISGTVTTIPNAPSRLNNGRNFITDGILREAMPSCLTDRDEAYALAKETVEALNLDYATVTITVDPDSKELEVVNVNTNLVHEDALALRSYMDKLHVALNKKK
jgi:hypothetical protein